MHCKYLSSVSERIYIDKTRPKDGTNQLYYDTSSLCSAPNICKSCQVEHLTRSGRALQLETLIWRETLAEMKEAFEIGAQEHDYVK